MKRIKTFRLFESSKSDLEYLVSSAITDLMDKNFKFTIDYDSSSKTYDYIEVTINTPYDDSKPYDENPLYYWDSSDHNYGDSIKEDIIFLVDLLSNYYEVTGIIMSICQGNPVNYELTDLFNLDLKEVDENITYIKVSMILDK